MPSDNTSKELGKLREIVMKDNVKDLSKTKKTEFDKYALKT
jgi:hypothetical protein